MFLAERGVHPVGIDVSERQLEAARRLTVDVVLSDHGAMSWADPYKTVPEVAGVLRVGGRFAFNTSTPWLYVAHPGGERPPSDRLLHSYFGLHRVDEGDGAATFVLGYGDWLQLFRRCGLVVEDHVELRPRDDAVTTYEDYVTVEWARRWPAEAIWVTTRR
jgi:SAM-dependent methyltransferase